MISHVITTSWMFLYIKSYLVYNDDIDHTLTSRVLNLSPIIGK